MIFSAETALSFVSAALSILVVGVERFQCRVLQSSLRPESYEIKINERVKYEKKKNVMKKDMIFFSVLRFLYLLVAPHAMVFLH